MRAAMRAKAPGAEAPVVPRSPALGALRLTLVRSGGEGRRRGSALSLCRTPHTARGRPFRQTAWRNPSRTCASLGHQKGGRGHHTASRGHTENERQNWGCFCFFCLWPCSAASPRPSGAPQPRSPAVRTASMIGPLQTRETAALNHWAFRPEVREWSAARHLRVSGGPWSRSRRAAERARRTAGTQRGKQHPRSRRSWKPAGDALLADSAIAPVHASRCMLVSSVE